MENTAIKAVEGLEYGLGNESNFERRRTTAGRGDEKPDGQGLSYVDQAVSPTRKPDQLSLKPELSALSCQHPPRRAVQTLGDGKSSATQLKGGLEQYAECTLRRKILRQIPDPRYRKGMYK